MPFCFSFCCTYQSILLATRYPCDPGFFNGNEERPSCCFGESFAPVMSHAAAVDILAERCFLLPGPKVVEQRHRPLESPRVRDARETLPTRTAYSDNTSVLPNHPRGTPSGFSFNKPLVFPSSATEGVGLALCSGREILDLLFRRDVREFGRARSRARNTICSNEATTSPITVLWLRLPHCRSSQTLFGLRSARMNTLTLADRLLCCFLGCTYREQQTFFSILEYNSYYFFFRCTSDFRHVNMRGVELLFKTHLKLLVAIQMLR